MPPLAAEQEPRHAAEAGSSASPPDPPAPLVLVPDETAQAEILLLDAIGPKYRAVAGDRVREVRTHLDTVDQRLRQAGIALVYSDRGRCLIAHRAGRPITVQPLDEPQWPALMADLPAGPVRDLISRQVWVRALLPFATSAVHKTSYAVVNRDTKTVARIWWSEGELLTPQSRSLPAQVEVEALRGYAADAAAVLKRLAAAKVAVSDSELWVPTLDAVAASLQRANQRFGMRPDQPADLAVADALLGHLGELEANVAGVIADIDTEYLHELRVAVRRTRSVLKLLGDLLPADAVAWARGEFGWLGDATTATRDLDVYLLGVDEMRAAVNRPAHLDGFAAHVRLRRQSAHAELSVVLQSERYREFCARWRASLAEVLSAPDHHAESTAEVARTRLLSTFEQVSRRAQAISKSSPGARVHALRKKCKEMRYLMEVFRPICDPVSYKQVIADFKEIQEVLGDFQDGEVQAAALREFAAEMMVGGDADVDTILAMGQLAAAFDARQVSARKTLDQHHRDYLGPRAARHVSRLVPA